MKPVFLREEKNEPVSSFFVRNAKQYKKKKGTKK